MPKQLSPELSDSTAARLQMSREELDAFLSSYLDMLVLYRAAIRQAGTMMEVLDDEFQFRHKRNPIHHIQSRLKSPESMLEKILRRGIEPNVEALQQELTDIAGIRVICSYVDDIYHLAELVTQRDDITLIRVHDYIKRPKPGGYRSLHMVAELPVHLSDGRHMVPIEIQIRTIAMDFWASLEHELRYKAEGQVPAALTDELRSCAEAAADLDCRMQAVYHELENIIAEQP